MNRYEFYSNLDEYKSIKHYGIIGQKWGQRRWQYADGRFNEEGKERYFGRINKKEYQNEDGSLTEKGNQLIRKHQDEEIKKMNSGELKFENKEDVNKYLENQKNFYSQYYDVDKYNEYLNQLNKNETNENATRNYLKEYEGLSYEEQQIIDNYKESFAEENTDLDEGPEYDRQLNEYINSFGDFKYLDEDYKNKLKEQGYIEDDEFNMDEINNHMWEDFEYDNSDHKLQSPQKTFDKKSGNCHDQTVFEMDMLKKNGYKPKAAFLMEIDPETGEGGQTHSFVYYNPYGYETDPNKAINWFENAWHDKAGIHSYSNFNALKQDIERYFGTDKNKYTKIVWGEFDGEPGDDLQDIIDKSLKKEL